MSLPQLDDIRLFVEIARTSSFRIAAAQLGMPASTLSRRIAALEQTIGLRLLNRTTRSVKLTAEGQAYLDQCKHLVEAIETAHQDIGRMAHEASGVLRLSCTPDFAAFYLAPVISKYQTQYPAVGVELSLTSRAEDLLSNNLDMAVRMGPVHEPNLIARPLAQLYPLLCASPRYLKQAPALNHPDDLQHHACIRLNTLNSTAKWTLQHPSHGIATVTISSKLIAGGPQMAGQLVMQHLGIGLLDPVMASPFLHTGRLVHLLPQWQAAPVQVHALMQSRLIPARVRFFIEHLEAELQAALKTAKTGQD